MLPPGKHLVIGNVACAEGAIRAGCRFFAGYPITPANEISEHMSAELPKVGGYFLQMEDEIASMAAVIGASWAGGKAMTATSGPGFSLMQENISHAHMTETPCVVVDVQRGGPSTGQSTMPAQQDIYQAKYGAHGDYEVIALSPWSVQEMYDLTVKAFNLAEQFRTPVILLADGMTSSMMEKLVVPEEAETVDRRRPSGPTCTPFGTEDPSSVPEMPKFGDGYRLLITGSSHDPTGLRDYDPKVMEAKLKRIRKKILKEKDRLKDLLEFEMEGAEIVVLSYGASARPSRGAVMRAREEGTKAGLLRLRTIWPFPEEDLRRVGENVKAILVAEMNMGKLVREVERAVCGRAKIASFTKEGGVVPSVEEVYQAIRRVERCL